MQVKLSLQLYRNAVYGIFVTDAYSNLLSVLQRTSMQWKGDTGSGRPFGRVYLGCETRTDPSEYRWDGMKRGADPDYPGVIFQATLRGWGVFERGGRRWTVGPGQALFCIVPSDHIYYLPSDSPEWSFFWLTFAHKYVVERLRELSQMYPPVFSLDSQSAFMSLCLEFFERSCEGRFEDHFEEEQALFSWMIALERHLHELAHPGDMRDSMLEQARRYTMENLSRSFGVEELAAQCGMSRSHYSHRFRRATGLSPAAYVSSLRLDAARRLLTGGKLPLKDIAEETGFSDANHLCKLFRRAFHMSPGTYRRQFGLGVFAEATTEKYFSANA